MTLRHELPVKASSARTSRLRITLATVAVLATLPYVVLKLMWLLGSTVGLDDPDIATSGVMEAANLVTMLMEVTAAGLAVALVLPIGRRIPSLLVQVPMFVGTGLLGGILLLLPTQTVLTAFSPPRAPEVTTQAEPIQAWVYTMVYGGFALLGICLIAIFVMHSWDRWVRPGGWATRLASWAPVPTRRRVIAISHGLLLVALCATELVVVARAELLGGHQVVALLMSTVTCAGLTALALGVPGSLRGSTALVMAYVGAAAVACWGLFFAVLLIVPNPLRGDDLAGPAGLEFIELARFASGALVLLTVHCLRPRAGARSAQRRPVSRSSASRTSWSTSAG